MITRSTLSMTFHENKLAWLASAHVIIICLSNILVQYPFTLFGFQTTWGAFSYPIIFILTDLTTRILGQQRARKIILIAMLPGLIGSCLISNYSHQGVFLAVDLLALRIAVASLLAYLVGQLLDIFIFQKLREQARWWVAPSVSNVFGNFIDTFCFFFIAFYQSSHLVLGSHWVEIATVDLIFKIGISLLTVVPLYGVILQYIYRQKPSLSHFVA